MRSGDITNSRAVKPFCGGMLYCGTRSVPFGVYTGNPLEISHVCIIVWDRGKSRQQLRFLLGIGP